MKAIILAAGMGTRLRPLTEKTPKALIPVNGKPIIERQIECLQEKNIFNITVVIGYLKEKFYYLSDKYGVELVENNKFDQYNNIYTMYLVRELLPNSYVLEGDVFLKNNILIKEPQNSTYFCLPKPNFKNEWSVSLNKNEEVIDIQVGDGENKYILSGVSYLNQQDGELIANEIEKRIFSSNFEELYWDNVVKENLDKISIKCRKLKIGDVFEVDSIEDLAVVEQYLNGSDTNVYV